VSGSGYRYIIVLLFVLSAACTEAGNSAVDVAQYSLARVRQSQWKLPKRLQEVSGLAMAPDGRLFAVDDEKAVIYQIDYTSGRLLKAFAVGRPVLRGDFEGIAYLGDHLFLITSQGMLLQIDEGEDGDRVGYREIDTGLGEQCEVEGLGQDLQNARLLIVCKKVRNKATIETLAIFAWHPGSGRVDIDDRIELPVEEILKSTRTEDFHPSGIAVDPLSGSILIVAARQREVVELDQKGRFVSAIMLSPAKRHKQAEGIEITASGQLIISDEGGRSRARLTVYEPPGIGKNTNKDK